MSTTSDPAVDARIDGMPPGFRNPKRDPSAEDIASIFFAPAARLSLRHQPAPLPDRPSRGGPLDGQENVRAGAGFNC